MVFGGVVGGFVLLLIRNAEASPQLIVVVPTQAPPTEDEQAWQVLLGAGFGGNSTPLPTVPIPSEAFAPPTLPPTLEDSDAVPIQPGVVGTRVTQAFSVGVTPTEAPDEASPTPLVAPQSNADADNVVPPVYTEQSVDAATKVWQPPPLIPPISRDPYGRDHYWLSRPVDSDATNFGLFYYPYGSDGQNDDNPWRVHHGIDMPNPVGETVRAAGSGKVVYAANSLVEQVSSFQSSFSYGNVILIEHDFGYRGQPIYTLYAHLSAVLAEDGQFVENGDVIGLVGETGQVSGPHVHFEVRVGGDRYADTYNPVLWMVPYVGHGVIAGQVLDLQGNEIQDADVTLRSWATGLVEDTTTSYIYQDTPSDVNADPIWQENFTFADVPEGRYEVVATINGKRVSKFINVQEGTTAFVRLQPAVAATSEPPTLSPPTITPRPPGTPLRANG